MLAKRFFVAFLHHGELLFELDQALLYNIVHFCCIVLDLLVNLVQRYARLVNFYQLLFGLLNTRKCCRLVQKTEKHVSNLLHGKHSRLLEPLCFQLCGEFCFLILKKTPFYVFLIAALIIAHV